MQNNLKELLDARGLTVSEFARQTGIPQPTLYRIVNGQVNLEGITAVNYIRIAHGLGLTVEQLYFGNKSYDDKKALLDRIYATTSDEGRSAMLANAFGVYRAYPKQESTLLPTIRNDMNALKLL
jgi:transcriptional regulator with XRE-family HTH domain